MKRLLAVNLSMTLILALVLISCDKDKKLTGPTEPSPAGQAASQQSAKATTAGGICNRPQQVQDAILAELSILAQLSMSNCASIGASHLESITGSLLLSYKGLTEVPSGTFDGLSNLEHLHLDGNGLEALPAAVFDGLDSLKILGLGNNALEALPAGVFNGLDNLTWLSLSGNDLEALPADIFDGLSKLEALFLYSMGLEALPANVFDDLDNLKRLGLGYNDLEILPAAVFDDLDNLELLALQFNDLDLDALPSDFFDAFPNLTWLSLAGIGKDLAGDNTGTMTSLSYDWYDSIPNLETLDLGNNDLSALPADVFNDFTNLKNLRLPANDLEALPADIFDGLSKLEELKLNKNQLEALPADVFDGLSKLERLGLNINQLDALPAGLFDGLSSLESVDLKYNPGTPFTFTAELEQQDDDAVVVVKVAEGAPYDMAVTLSAEGGTLSSTDVTVTGGSVKSGAINVTPNGQQPTQVTVSVESAAFQKDTYGFQAGLGKSLTLTFGALEREDVAASTAPVSEQLGLSPSVAVALSARSVEQGTEITATMSFSDLESDADRSTIDYIFRADVVDADACEGGGMGVNRNINQVDEDPETRTGTLSADCPAGSYSVRVSLSSSDHTELASATADFSIEAQNTASTGAPTISGTAQVGETLTASTSEIADADGLSGTTFHYQWLSSTDTEIQGATGDTYTLQPDDAGKTIKVRVSFTDDAGYAESLTSAATVTVEEEDVEAPTAAISLSPAGPVAPGTEITATMSFSDLESDADRSTTDYIFRADVVGADACEGGSMGVNRNINEVDEDPETRTGTISAGCPVGSYSVRVSLSSSDHTELASATADFSIEAPVSEQLGSSPSVAVALSARSVEQGTEITATMSFSDLESDADRSTTDYIFRADVVGADACEGGGMGNDRYFYQVDENPEVRTGTISAGCPAGTYTLKVRIWSPDNVELASASADFSVAGH